MINRILSLIRKEFTQLSRDKSMIFVLLFFPLMLLIIFGYAVNFDVKNISFYVYDADKSELSREFVNGMKNSEYFNFKGYLSSEKEISQLMNSGEVQFVAQISKNFEQEVTRGKENTSIQLIIDGVDGNTASIINNYLVAAVSDFSKSVSENQLNKFGKKFVFLVDAEMRFWFNPDLQTTLFLIPGLIGMILIITAVVTVSLSLVREKERGTIEQLNVSSLNIIELLIGKLTPYFLISIMEAALVLIAGFVLFGIVVKGSYFLLLLSTIIFLFSATSMGIFISVISDSQQVAFTLSTFATLLPSAILSGFIFPIESMPIIIQALTNVSPVKFYLISLRSIIIKGVGLHLFWEQFLFMFLFGLFFIALSTVLSIKKQRNA
jgi:ABC-2 type transport system permease protein